MPEGATADPARHTVTLAAGAYSVTVRVETVRMPGNLPYAPVAMAHVRNPTAAAVRVDTLRRGREHPAGALADNLVDQGAGLGGALVGDHAEHGRAFPARAANAGLLGDRHRIIREGMPSASFPGLIHRSRASLSLRVKEQPVTQCFPRA